MRVRDFAPIQRILESSSKSWSLDEMKRMLDLGLVSVLDIDDDGRTALHYAVIQQEWPIARLLISYGADVNHENKDSLSPFIDAWTKRFRFQDLPRDILKDWDKLFLQDRSQMDVFGFSDLHKSYLGLSGLTFGEVLALTDRSCIDNGDSLGRTVLYWAADRGDSHTVAKLLAMGADPNKQNKIGYTPLHCAVRIDTATSEILLNAKADPKIVDLAGYTPLHGIRENNACFIKRIVELGADINRINEQDATALHYACAEQRVKVVQELLACGADINILDKYGRNEVFTAIYLNCHQILSILISNPSVQLSVTDSCGWDIPMFAAAYGDIQTLEILRDEWPAGIDFGRRGEGNKPLELAQYRRDENEDWSHNFSMPPDPDPLAWFDAFEDMVNVLVKGLASKHEPKDPAYQDEVWEDAREHFDDL